MYGCKSNSNDIRYGSIVGVFLKIPRNDRTMRYYYQEYKRCKFRNRLLAGHKYWHKGYAVEAATLSEYGFKTLNLDNYIHYRDTTLHRKKCTS